MTGVDDHKDNPKVYNEEEIELLVSGESRKVDRHTFVMVNNLTAAFLNFQNKVFPEHAKTEEELHRTSSRILSELGNPELLKKRMQYLDKLIERQEVRNRMMISVATSGLAWALILFLGFLGVSMIQSVRHAILDMLKPAQSQTPSPPPGP